MHHLALMAGALPVLVRRSPRARFFARMVYFVSPWVPLPGDTWADMASSAGIALVTLAAVWLGALNDD